MPLEERCHLQNVERTQVIETFVTFLAEKGTSRRNIGDVRSCDYPKANANAKISDSLTNPSSSAFVALGIGKCRDEIYTRSSYQNPFKVRQEGEASILSFRASS